MPRQFNPLEIPASPDLHFEARLWASGFNHVAGLDEAGRGAWAGPVAAGSAILPADPGIIEHLNAVRDSKEMTPTSRAFWVEEIKKYAAAWGVGFASHQEIDALGIVPATHLAMRRALGCLSFPAGYLLIDALLLPEVDLPQAALIKGDARSLSIAAASVLAKTARDCYMVEIDEKYPEYGFARHKGYGTAFHQAALERLGPCELHRKSFQPVKSMTQV